MEKVTLENYTEHCLKTWGGDNQEERAILGVLGEMGEICEVEKKFLRGDFDKTERNKRMLKEIGDVMYYLAIMIYLGNKTADQPFDFKTKILNDMRVAAESVSCDIFTVLYNYEYADPTISALAVMQILGFTIEEVLQANIDKLRSRAKRNQIQGDGDER